VTLKDAAEKIKTLLLEHREPLVKAAVYSGAAGCAALALLFGPTRMVELTESPEFCGLCHSMDPHSATWRHSMHRSARCIDCHLPNDNFANHYFWKAIDGNKDVFYEFSGLREHDEIELSAHGHRVLQANCIRCHGGMVEHINKKRACVDCHRAAGHKAQGLPQTREDQS
jgi:cytochrome c nitrite reductase small subunit